MDRNSREKRELYPEPNLLTKPKNNIREAELGTRSRSKIQAHESVTQGKIIQQQLKTVRPNLGRKQKTGGAVTKLDWPGEPTLADLLAQNQTPEWAAAVAEGKTKTGAKEIASGIRPAARKTAGD
jgi:hypothetical protein